MPSKLLQLSLISGVPGNVPLELLGPEFGPGGRHGREAAAKVTVPVAAVDEDRDAPHWQHNVRPPREVATVQPEAEAHRVKGPPQSHLRLGVGSFD